MTGSGQVTELWRHKTNSLRPTFQGNCVFSHGNFCHWLEWRYYAWFRSADDHIRPLALRFDLSKVIRGHYPWLTRRITKVVILADFGVSWGLETEYVANFSPRHVYSGSLHNPMSIRAIDSVCPQAILAMGVALFTSGTPWVTNIPLINCNYQTCVQSTRLSWLIWIDSHFRKIDWIDSDPFPSEFIGDWVNSFS